MASSASVQKALEAAWDINDVTTLFRVSIQTIHNWRSDTTTHKRPMPALVIPGRSRPALRFFPDEVRKWANENGITMYGKNRKA